MFTVFKYILVGGNECKTLHLGEILLVEGLAAALCFGPVVSKLGSRVHWLFSSLAL